MFLSCGVRDIGTIIIVSIICLMLISMVFIIRQMVIYYLKIRREREKLDNSCKIPFVLVTIITTLVATVLIVYIPYLSHSCIIYQSVWTAPYSLSYIWQFYFLVLFWLYRLYDVFDGSMIPISKWTVILYIIFYTIIIIWSSTFTSLYSFKKISAAQFATESGISLVFYLIGSFAISILFASKLVRLHKSFASNVEFATNNDRDKSLLMTVSKLSILTWISLLITLIQSIALPVRFILFPNSILMEFIGHFNSVIDPYTNFLCIILSYSHFHQMYLKICCMHSCCFRCWMRCANVSVDMVELAHTVSQENKSGHQMTSSNSIATPVSP